MSTHPKDDSYYKKIFIAVSKVHATEHEKKYNITKLLKKIATYAMKRAALLEDFHYYSYWEDSPQMIDIKKQLADQEEKLIKSFEGLSPFMEDLKKIDKNVIELLEKIGAFIPKEKDGK